MSLITLFSYDINSVKSIKDWGYGSNWPVVYIIYNDKKYTVTKVNNAKRGVGAVPVFLEVFVK